jgi:AcrR family transcriptional regulator
MNRSPAADRIVSAAVGHFARRGYDASSLAEIAESVGIRKASLYAHFSSKDELYMQIFADALQMEKDIAHQCFASETNRVLPGFSYCINLIERYDESDYLKFLLRTGYMPAAALAPQVYEDHERYLEQLQKDLEGRLIAWIDTKSTLSKEDIQLYGHAYIGIVDSLQVKLVYTDTAQAAVRLKAMERMWADALASLIRSEQMQ